MFAHLNQKGTKTLDQLKQLGNSRWGLREKDWVRLMESVLLPRVSYGPRSGATYQNKCKLKALADKVDNAAAIYSLGNFKSTPLTWHRERLAVKEAATYFLSTSLRLFTRKLTKKRLDTRVEWILLDRGFRKPDWIAKHHPLPQDQLDQLQQTHPKMIHIQYKRDPNHPRANFLHLQLSKEEAVEATTSLVSAPQNSNSWIVYTDGLYDPENGGASAAVCPELTMAISAALGVNPYYSNHECEAIGLFLALQLLKQAMGQERRSRAFILTDNMGVICRLENYNQAKPGQYIFQEIAALWKDIQADINLTFVWCPGHRGIQGNEAADFLAKDTTERNESPNHIMKANRGLIAARPKGMRTPPQTPKKKACGGCTPSHTGVQTPACRTPSARLQMA
ncbi:hypothetical protein PCASD_25848 [Puccinia coronata f. sp. avenae]|uniref:RNase H type-1 domain-containing protein n=1 Tax=Puccinia coronata f. sp. avenae TaxID=200324 RepID=A0A2N5RZN1_9BASI|nr:hypothetical protein PCASD_25848 [Puccinia coronata f. sp. avenae]